MADDVTVPASPGAFVRPSQIGKQLGRYRIDGVLGEGGMGVVYLAFDPDLQRNVALKVLRDERSDDDARLRLLREARALAKVSHPNVVAVHEVGSIDGRDFIAMEYIDGVTLADWVRIDRPTEEHIIHAYLAAGRGLAAAHATGLVHRDFKPHNVLRTDDGRVVVTDFGLARDVDATRSEATKDELAASPSTTVTETGHVLGTPAYMAPEQWNSEPIGPAADQFAYCVALWEALDGKRPFRGGELLAAIEAGPGDAPALPRGMRTILVRGLALLPNARWPSMDALIAEIVRVQARPMRYAIAGGAVMALGVVVFGVATRFSDEACEAPRIDPATLATDALLREEVARFTTVRGEACKAKERTAKLACLDGVLERIAIVAAVSKDVSSERVAMWLVDPGACLRGSPNLALRANAETIAAVRAEVLQDATAATRFSTAVDPCARAIASVAVSRSERQLTSVAHADRCGDDHLRARLAYHDLQITLGKPGVSSELGTLRERAESALSRIPQPSLTGMLHLADAALHAKREEIEEGLAAVDRAVVAFGPRMRLHEKADVLGARAWLLVLRSERADLERVRAEVAPLRTEALDPESLVGVETADALAALLLGDVASARATLLKLVAAQPKPTAHRIAGRVVDEHGAPAANVEVWAAPSLYVVEAGILPLTPGVVRGATTGADGTFAIDNAAERSTVIALAGDRRSRAMPSSEGMQIALAPTRTISGRIELGTTPASKLLVSVIDIDPPTFHAITPVAPDGTFTVARASTAGGRLVVTHGIGHDRLRNVATVGLPASTADIANVTIDATPTKRRVYVIVRSTYAAPLENAVATLATGDLSRARTLADVRHVPLLAQSFARDVPADLDEDVRVRMKPNDFLVTFDAVPTAADAACGSAVPRDPMGAEATRYRARYTEIEVRCVTLPKDAKVVVVEAPPLKRLD